jgi:hypothetical protein
MEFDRLCDYDEHAVYFGSIELNDASVKCDVRLDK